MKQREKNAYRFPNLKNPIVKKTVIKHYQKIEVIWTGYRKCKIEVNRG